jgi:hypothetical protein
MLTTKCILVAQVTEEFAAIFSFSLLQAVPKPQLRRRRAETAAGEAKEGRGLPGNFQHYLDNDDI